MKSRRFESWNVPASRTVLPIGKLFGCTAIEMIFFASLAPAIALSIIGLRATLALISGSV